MKYLFLLTILFVYGCEEKTYKCGEMIPITHNSMGINTSFKGNVCHNGSWEPVPTGPWYICKCKKRHVEEI